MAGPLFDNAPGGWDVPTGPPSLEEAERRDELAIVAGRARPRLPVERVVTIWVGAGSTVLMAGLTGLLLSSRWSYLTLGGAFVSLAAVAIAVGSPSDT